MKKIFLLCLFACAVGTCINAYAGYTETETINTYEKIYIDTITYTNAAYIAPVPAPAKKPAPKPVHKPAPQPKTCRYASSLDVSRKDCGCEDKQLKPVSVKTYTEVIDHYQVYEPVVSYKPAGTYTTRRYIKPASRCAQ